MGARRLWSVAGAVLGVCLGVLALACAPALAAGAPVVEREWVSNVHTDQATLNARINPGELASTYRFEYGTGESYGTTVPVPDASAGSGSVGVVVSQIVHGLAPGTVYHYRVVAGNSEGMTEGPDHVLKTYPAASTAADSCGNAGLRGVQFSSYLPDCRAYELVSPPNKEGGNVSAFPSETQAAASGNAIKYISLAAFGDAAGINIQGAEYISQREPDGSGWFTHGVNPEQNSLIPGFFASQHYAAFSEDLSKGVFWAFSPVLPGFPNVEKAANLYLRDDALSGPPGVYQLLSDSVTELPRRRPLSGAPEVAFAGASADWKHIIFESGWDLTPDSTSLSTEHSKLYEWHDGHVTLVGILPNGEPAEASIAGDGAGSGSSNELPEHNSAFEAERHPISADGSRVIFEAGPLAGKGELENGTAGRLFMRIDGRETVQLDVSERSEPDPREFTTTFAWANADDSKILFTTRRALTDDAVADHGEWLYMYDVNAPAGKHLKLISVDNEPNVEHKDHADAVVGVSDDFSYIYFVGKDRLVAGQPLNNEDEHGTELYVWHDNTVRFIVSRPRSSGVRLLGEPSWGEWGFDYGFSSYQYGFRASPDGRRAMFESLSRDAARRVGYDDSPGGPGYENEFPSLRGCQRVIFSDTGGSCQQVYVYDYASDRLVCASCRPTGELSESNAGFESEADAYGFAAKTQYLPRALSADGRFVFFDTSEALVPQDTNGQRDVYEFDTLTGTDYLISGGTCDCGSYFTEASADGSNVFFTTHQRLVRADVDSAGDMYDARIEGGIAAQNVLPVVPCEGDDCQGPAKGTPVFSLPSSSTFAGIGNPTSGPPRAVAPRRRALTRSQKLARALRACRSNKHGHGRIACEKRARRHYKAKSAVKRSSGR